jgi:hypothetical protein
VRAGILRVPLLLLALVAPAAGAGDAGGGSGARPSPAALVRGGSLTEALRHLERGGLRLLWSDAVVPRALTVQATPVSSSPLAQLDELLAPHGLVAEANGELLVIVRARSSSPETSAGLAGTVLSRADGEPVSGAEVRIVELDRASVTGIDGSFSIAALPPGSFRVEARKPGFVIEEPAAATLVAGATVRLELGLRPAPFSGEEIVVQPSRISLLSDDPAAPLTLARDEIAALPHLAGDLFRALDLLPGVAANDISAEVHVRGGRRDETLVLLDGQEIYDAYHLKDFDNALSVVPAPTVDLLHLSTGSLPVRRGDRMGAALELTTFEPADPGRFRISVSLLDFQVESSGRSPRGASWLGSLRYGNGALAGALFGEEDPTFWDLFGKSDFAIGERQSLRGSVLASADRLDFFEEIDSEQRRFLTEYGNRYFWLTHQALLSDRLYVDSSGSLVRIDRDRRGFEDEEEKTFAVRDERDMSVVGVQQSWGFQPGKAGSWSAGFEARRYDAEYDYTSVREFDSQLASLRSEPRDGAFDYRGRVVDEALGAWLSYRARPSPQLTLEVGGRYDRHTGTDDTIWSPRAALAWSVSEGSVVRLAAGRHTQSQRAYELMVADGDTRLYPVERATHSALGFEHRFSERRGRPLSAIRIEIYDHRVATPRPRYESLYEPFEPFPEGELDRVRIEPASSRSQGVELFVHGRPGKIASWWLNYSYARAEDRIDDRWTARSIDQRHTLNADLTLRLGPRWNLNLAWRYHTGRPTTPLTLAFDVVPHDDDGEGPPDEGEDDDDAALAARLAAEHELVPRPVLGALNSARLPDYHRLDLRVSRDWALRRGKLTFFADVQNLYDRDNVAGYDIELDDAETAAESAILRVEEPWPGFLASAGVSWQF